MMLVGMSDPGLAILPTHRLVSGLPALTSSDLANAISSHLAVEKMGTGEEAAKKTWMRMERDGGQNVFGFGTASDSGWLFARVTDASPMSQLAADQSDACAAGSEPLAQARHRRFAETAVSTERANVPICASARRALQAIDSKSCQLACLVPPARIEHVESIASQFEKMPPKSTYFYPKLLSGLVFNPLT